MASASMSMASCTESARLDGADRLLPQVLVRDGHPGLTELAAVTGWSCSTVHRRVNDLASSGALSFDVDQRLFPAIAAWPLHPAHGDRTRAA